MILKMLMTLFMIFILVKIFGIEYNYYNDFRYYVSNPYGTGPNIGFRFLLNYLSIHSVNDFPAVFLAFTLNILIDIVWIFLFKRYLNNNQILIFTVMLALHPYLATYTLKFSSIIFAKLAVVYFFYFLINQDTTNTVTKAKYLTPWIFLMLVRNSNIFIFLPILIYNLWKKPVLMLVTSMITTVVIYYVSTGYLDGLNTKHWPWNYKYVSDLLGTDDSYIVWGIVATSRIFLLFGAREKLFTEGIEPFLTSYLSTLELLIYFLISIMQLCGLFVATHYFFRRFSYPCMLTFVPLLLALVSVSHTRYLIPYVPLCLFGISLMFRRQNVK